MKDITEQIRESQDAADALVGEDQRRWKINAFDGDGNPVEREFIQEELGFFPKQEFMNLLTAEIDKFIRGEYGIKLGDLFSGDLRTQLAPPDLSDPNQSADRVNKTIEENIGLINAFIKLVRTVPELQKEIIALALGVKRGAEREWFKWAISEPPSRGGLTDEQGFEILKIFIRQNAKAIRSFFEDKATELVEEFRREVLQESTTSEDSTEPSTEEEPKETPLVEDAPTPGGTPSSTSSLVTPASV
jgi:hypothetical protein